MGYNLKNLICYHNKPICYHNKPLPNLREIDLSS